MATVNLDENLDLKVKYVLKDKAKCTCAEVSVPVQ